MLEVAKHPTPDEPPQSCPNVSRQSRAVGATRQRREMARRRRGPCCGSQYSHRVQVAGAVSQRRNCRPTGPLVAAGANATIDGRRVAAAGRDAATRTSDDEPGDRATVTNAALDGVSHPAASRHCATACASFFRTSHRVVCESRNPHRASHQRQRLGLPFIRLRAAVQAELDSAQLYESISAANQRQSRAFHSDAATRMGVCEAVRLVQSATRGPAAVATPLQPPTTSWQSRWRDALRQAQATRMNNVSRHHS